MNSETAHTAEKQSFGYRVGYILGDCIQLGVVGLLLHFLLFEGSRLSVIPQLLLLGVLLIGISRSAAWTTLLGIQISLILREPASRQLDPNPMNLAYVLLACTVFVYALRAKSLREKLSRFLGSACESIVSGNWQEPESEHQIRSSAMVARLLHILAVVCTSVFVFSFLPLTQSSRESLLELSRPGAWILWPGTWIVVIALAGLLLVRELAWKQLSAAQAQIYRRSTLMQEYRRELVSTCKRKIRLGRQTNSDKTS